MHFSYSAVQGQGQTIRGHIEADSEREALRLLQGQGMTVLGLHPDRTEREQGSRRLTSKLLHLFMTQLSALLNSSIPIDEAVKALHESEANSRLRRASAAMLKALQSGHSFSDALEAAALPLPNYYYLLARSGEMTGNLAESMRAADSQWAYEQETRRRLMATLTYPLILICTGIGAVLLIFILVVPRFETLLTRSGKEIPLLTKLILVPGSFFNHHMPQLLLLSGCALLALIMAFTNTQVRQKAREWLLYIPLFSTWMQEMEIGKWAGMMATLLGNRVELVQALELSARFIGPTNMQRQFQTLTNAVRAGTSLSEAIREKQLLPPTGINLVRVGERTGDLPAMLRSLADLTDNSVKGRTATLLSLLEPIAILIIGAVIGLVMAGLILGITSVNEMV